MTINQKIERSSVVVEISNKRIGGFRVSQFDSIQLAMIILFFVVWGVDSLSSFIFSYSTVLRDSTLLLLRFFLAIVSVGFSLYLIAKSHKVVFGEAHDQPRLIDSGVYSWVRHPMYLGILLFCLGFFFASPSLFSLGVWLVFFILYDKMTTYEENDLMRILGEEYIAYQKRVPKWFPKLRRRSVPD